MFGCLKLLGGWLAVAFYIVAMNQSAFAHVSLDSTNPPENATLRESPKELSLTFSEPVRLINAEVVNTKGLKVIGTGQARIEGAVLNIPVEENLPNGVYHINYQLVGVADSHPLAGSVTFSIHMGD